MIVGKIIFFIFAIVSTTVVPSFIMFILVGLEDFY